MGIWYARPPGPGAGVLTGRTAEVCSADWLQRGQSYPREGGPAFGTFGGSDQARGGQSSYGRHRLILLRGGLIDWLRPASADGSLSASLKCLGFRASGTPAAVITSGA